MKPWQIIPVPEPTPPSTTGPPVAAANASLTCSARMRLFTERGIPCVMAGPGEARLAHAVDERVALDDVLRTARMLVRVILGFSAAQVMPPLDQERSRVRRDSGPLP